MIPPLRMNQINKLAEFIANDFFNGNLTLLDKVAKDEDIFYHFDQYEDGFDGMLAYADADFHIHINTENGNGENTKRGRFTFAHELGHFFIEEHRLGLKYGLLEPHASFHNLNQKNRMEVEADYFAGCLLMPYSKFRKKASERRSFSFDTITDLSESFQASILSTIIRFGEIGTHEIFAVVSKNNIAQWFVKSNDFPNWKFKFKIGGTLPQTTVAGEFYTIEDRKFRGVEKLSADDWFSPSYDDHRAGRQMYEQCYYSDSYGYVVSLMWFD
jgi:Zn-dependent peptidase ImmA (M78 family)